MKAKNKKLNSILTLIVLFVVIGCVTFFAYKACKSVGKGQSSDVNQVTTEAATNTEATDAEASESPEATEEAKASESPEATEEAKASESPEATEEAKASESPEATEEAKASESPEATDGAEVTESPEATDEAKDKETTKVKKPGFFDTNKIQLGLDLQGGVDIVYEPQLDEGMSEEELASAMQGAQALIQNRLDTNGYTEAEVAIEGTTRLRVQIPGVEDPQKAIDEIGAAGMLYFYDQPILAEGQKVNTILTGKNIKSARAAQNSQTGEYVVSIQLDDEGTKIFDDYTANHLGETIYIYLDDTLLSYPSLSAHITDGSGQISGHFTLESAKKLADGINAGALPFTLTAISADSVGAKLGTDALRTSLLAGIIGFIIIMVFMAVMYRICGIAADIALVLYVGLEVLVLTMMNATLTLPGIAGILLSIGMAVDANVIIFARIREELNTGKSVRLAVEAGFDKALRAIIDGNITTLIAAAVLYFFGTGLIKSFATTLIVGIVISMFTALVITRLVLKSFVGMNIKKPTLYAKINKTGKEA